MDLKDQVKEFVKYVSEKYDALALEKHKEYREKQNKSGRPALHAATHRKKYGNLRKKAHLSPEERKAIKEFYRNRPPGMHVDHIIPLTKGGQHCLANLRYLPARDNISKRNLSDEEWHEREAFMEKLRSERERR